MNDRIRHPSPCGADRAQELKPHSSWLPLGVVRDGGLINIEVKSGGLHKNVGERREMFPKIRRIVPQRQLARPS